MTPTVVIVDDQADLRLLLRRTIERDGRCRIVGEAADGAEALAVIDASDPDVLLLDLGMPGMDGLEVLSVLGSRPRPRVVVLTGFTDPRTHARALALGAVDCLVKGVGFTAVADTIVAAARLSKPTG